MEKLLEYHNLIIETLKEIQKYIFNLEIVENDIETKSNRRDIVTIVDKKVEEIITNKIKNKYPYHYILGEETYDFNYEIKEENVWVIDPIDATANFVKQKEDYCILIAFFENKIPKLGYIFNVEKNELTYSIYKKGVFHKDKKVEIPKDIDLKSSLVSIDVRKMWGTKLLEQVKENAFDMRFIGCAGLDGLRVIKGEFGAFICPNLGPWDFAPLLLMAQELGLHISNFEGKYPKFGKRSDFIISTNSIFKNLNELDTIKK